MKCRIAFAQGGGLISLTERNAVAGKGVAGHPGFGGFAYYGEGDWPEVAHHLTFSVKNMPIQDLVELCFREQPLNYKLSIAEKTINVYVRPRQERIITGLIQDENMEPIGGANIIAPGDASTTSKDDGQFLAQYAL